MRNIVKLAASTVFMVTLSANTASAQVFTSDVIIQGSTCTGLDCVSGESFGFDTLRLKENNLRIHFDDTSASASFPANDWRIVANDSSNGGANYLAFEDATAGNQPFRVAAGAGANALIVDAQGDVGIGTATPGIELHIVDGDSPAIRLEQNGSNGFTPQVWDLAGNEANFFVRDVTNGSQLPFKIKPGADSDSLIIAANNNVGIGTLDATSSLHVKRSNGTAAIKVEETSTTAAARGMGIFKNNGDSFLQLENTAGNTWNFANLGGEARIISPNGPGIEFRLTTGGDLTITGELTTAGTTCGGGCDLVFDETYELDSIEEHAKKMWANKYLPTVGPTIENQPINLTDKVGKMLNELEKAHIYIEQLYLENKKANKQIARLEARLNAVAETTEN